MTSSNGNRPVQMFLHPRRKDRLVVTRAINQFDGILVGATAPASTVQFVADLGRPFFIDPMVYYFMLPPERIVNPEDHQVRETVMHLAESYGKLLADSVGRRIITAAELLAQMDALEALTSNVLDYQRRKFYEGNTNLFSPYYDKYAAFEAAGEPLNHVDTAQDPWVLIPPFFHFTTHGEPSYAASIRCAKIGLRERRAAEKLFPTIFCSPTALSDGENVEKMIVDYAESEADGYFIWINGLSEEKTSYRRAANLARFIEGLSHRSGKPVYKLYGGYLSILLSEWGLRGFTCDLSYKTHRDIFQYFWGPPQPIPRYYVPRLHRAYVLEEAEMLLRRFPFLGCSCALCAQAFGKDLGRFRQAMSEPGHCESHFLNVRRREIRDAGMFGSSSSLKDLQETVSRLDAADAEVTAHLRVWAHLLSELRTTRAPAIAPKLPSESMLRRPDHE